MNELDKSFRPTVEWMQDKYDEMNQALFGGSLGQCYFRVFTSGKGSQGGVLGWFKISNRGVYVNRSTRRMYMRDTLATRQNFFDLCKPLIEVNGNYLGTEYGFLCTLVHEMCHYYTYMYGYVPKQGHGREFKDIAETVSARSNGMFTIKRIASAEQMRNLELNDEMKSKREKRISTKKSKVIAYVIFKKGGISLSMSSHPEYEKRILMSCENNNDILKVVKSNDPSLIEKIFSKGYKMDMRPSSYYRSRWLSWRISPGQWLVDALYDSKYEEIYCSNEIDLDGNETPNVNADESHKAVQPPKMVFSLRTTKGVFETGFSSFDELRMKLRERFPNMSYETIERIMSNKNNFRKIEEAHSITNRIISEVINEFLEDEFGEGDSILINPDMNLGLMSPLEQ